MAGHEWDWFQREELIGQLSDIRVQNLQVERETVQKRTFTRWVNLHLEKCNPPLEVKDLFVDIQDGKVLMALLEVLTGQSLLQEYKQSAHRIFRLNNIAKALKFLEDSNVKLVSIDAAEIADGNPSLVLGLIWNIILFLQIKELTGNLNRMSSSSSLSSMPSGTESDTSNPSTPSTEKSMSVSIKDQRKAIKALLNWVQQRTRKYGVAVQDFAGSWRSGLAFLAIIKVIDSSLVDIKRALERPSRENLEEAFTVAEKSLSIPRLLEPEDVMVDSPDEQSIMTYVTQFLEHFPDIDADDFTDQSEELPVESTFVHYKDGPTEEEGKIITLNNGNDRPLTPSDRYFDAEAVIEDYNPTSHENFKNEPKPSTDYEQIVLPCVEKKPEPHNNFVSNEETLDTSEKCLTKNITKSVDQTTDSRDESVALLLPNGKDLNTPLESSDKMLPISKEHSLNHIFSDIRNHHTDSSQEEFLTDSKKSIPISHEPNKIFYQPKENLKHVDIDKEPTLSNNSNNLLAPTNSGEKENVYKYVSHLSNDISGSSYSKQMTVFQPYSTSTTLPKGKGDSEGPLQEAKLKLSDSDVPQANSTLFHPKEEVTESMDSTGSSKVSVIPHDLFYYPHYSVPIADVLYAFSETCPDGSKRSKVESFAPESQKEEIACNDVEAFLQVPPEKPKNGISLTKPDDFKSVMVDTVWDGDVGDPQSVSEMSKYPVIQSLGICTDEEPKNYTERAQPASSTSVADDTVWDIEYAQTGSDISEYPVSQTSSGLIKQGPKNGILRINSDNSRSTVEDKAWDVEHSEIELEISENPVRQSPRSLFFQEPIHTRDIDSTSDAAHASNIKRTETNRQPVLNMKSTKAAVSKRTELEEDLQVTGDGPTKPGADLADLWFSRATQSDTSVYYKREDYIPGQMNFESFMDQNVEGDWNTQLRKKGFGDTHPSERSPTPPADQFPDFYYIAVIIWILVYCMLILPELDISKVTFFASDE
ncbi:calmin isoform 2-T2 [Discoglossus pictus]